MECELKQEFHAMPCHTHTHNHIKQNILNIHTEWREIEGDEDVSSNQRQQSRKSIIHLCVAYTKGRKKLIKTINIIRVICRIRWNESEMPIVIKAMSKIATDRVRSFNEKKIIIIFFQFCNAKWKFTIHGWYRDCVRKNIELYRTSRKIHF